MIQSLVKFGLLSIVLLLATACGDRELPGYVVPAGSGALTIEDQRLESANTIMIEEVFADGPAFIAIFEDRDNSLGDPVGLLHFEGGRSTNKEMILDRDIEGEERLVAALYVDLSRDQSFERDDDMIARDEDGRRVRFRFQARVE